MTDPTSFVETQANEKWRVATDVEILMILKIETWEFVDRPSNQNVISVKSVYRAELNPDGLVNKYKARLLVKRYTQTYGIYFSDTFAPIVIHGRIRLIIALTTREDWKIIHLEVKSRFLNGILKEDIYITQLEGYEVQESEPRCASL